MVSETKKLSVVLPAFNEAATFEPLMEAVLHKAVPGVQIEIVLVESNSTDGTRELALKYQDHPRVRVVLEDRPQGKGHAVRTGLAQASGDFILIQDADLEYDLDDYDALLEPLIAGREAFTLGARHGGSAWKMRQFNDQPIPRHGAELSAHWGFTALINVCFFQRLKDPFTMYKVFRRDCLYGLHLECNRFDFDWELLINLVRKGYRPLEMPVNYRSRSFKEGKKVSSSATRSRGSRCASSCGSRASIPCRKSKSCARAPRLNRRKSLSPPRSRSRVSMRAFVTGGAGFIGSSLVDRLLAEGCEVVAWDNFSTGQERFVAQAQTHPAYRLVRGDNLDLPSLTKAMAGCDIVFHLAANADVRFGLQHPGKDLEQNTIATFHVLEAMRANGVKRIAFSSTGSVYGEAETIPTPEDAPFPVQTSLYGASKLACEGMIAAYCEGFGCEGYVFRFVSILGERYTHGHVFDFYKQLLAHPDHLDVLGDGSQRKSYLHIGDCVSAILHVGGPGHRARGEARRADLQSRHGGILPGEGFHRLDQREPRAPAETVFRGW